MKHVIFNKSCDIILKRMDWSVIVFVFCLFDATIYVDVVWPFIIEWTHLLKKKIIIINKKQLF